MKPMAKNNVEFFKDIIFIIRLGQILSEMQLLQTYELTASSADIKTPITYPFSSYSLLFL